MIKQKDTSKECIVHFEESGKSEPRPHEKKVAQIIADYFKSDIIFLRRISSKTPDLYILKTNIRWELKSPQGGGKHTIQNNLRATNGQSENVILDLSRAKLSDRQGISRTKEFIRKEHSRIKHLKLLTKDGHIIDIK